ncbi:uncharacterized protein LOC108627226 isoform X1 [Ceratina calcarata]|uniref:Uncharacterized protein LOC108627226 isoform X1 n=1 Tax=Ceratina calcarata TaxID=156304 RepID=A0AAJ7S5R1_9HYME|nr:uncharacterized protein LOC108627226 isoform X1 [Ceratina calcarata]XP_026671240.1 uncharacterized protein LOC108627226 isoform X1 [Ceratina calcarata]XP_026671241.1 uncharacterized protein LOC108627226 isoform X1 [Ceratina calcarata]
METLRSDTLCASDSMHSLSNINSRIDELSKEKEDFLCGTDEEGDDEDALSDDSLRLRLSDDDEEEAQSALTSALDGESTSLEINKNEVRPDEKGDVESAPVPDSEKNNTLVQSEVVNEEEQCSGNDLMDDNIVIVHEKKGTESTGESKKLQLNNMFRPWPCYEWRLARSNYRPFRSNPRYTVPRRYYRPQPYEHRRYSNVVPHFERGRANGMVNSYNTKQLPNKVQDYTPGESCNLKNSSGDDQNTESEPIKSTPLKETIIMDIIEVEEGMNTLNGESSVSNDDNDQKEEESLNENNSINNSVILENNSETIASNNDKCTDIIATEDIILNDKCDEQVTTSVIDSNDISYVQIDQTINNSIDTCSREIYNSDNSNQMDLSFVHKKSETTEFVKNHDVNNENQSEISSNTIVNVNEQNKEIKLDKQDLNKNTEFTDENQKIELSENNYILTPLDTTVDKEIVNNELNIDEGTATNEIEQSNENKRDTVIVQSLKSNERCEKKIISNDLTNNEDTVTQNNVLEELATATDKCDDTQLKNSDNSKNYIEICKPVEDETIQSEIKVQKDREDTIEKDVELTEKETGPTNVTNRIEQQQGNKESKTNEKKSVNVEDQNNFLGFVTSTKNDRKDDNVKKNDDVLVPTRKRRRRTKKMMLQELTSGEDTQVCLSWERNIPHTFEKRTTTVVGRQKRRTAKNAEEIIRKKFLSNDTDTESSDSSDKFVAVNYKMNLTPDVRPLSPPSLKRTSLDNHIADINGSIKRVKLNHGSLLKEVKETNIDLEKIKKLNFIRKFFHRDLNEKLPKITQEELEELLIQKIVETITMRDEIGKLREQAQTSERNQEIMRAKYQQLARQVKDFEMVLNRYASDRRANNDKTVPPIKINRSVGLQVNILVEPGVQNLRQLQQNSNIRLLHVSNSSNTPSTSTTETNNAGSPRRGIKVRSPRRTDLINGQTPVVSQNNTTSSNIMTTITPAALVVTKPVDTQHSLTLPNQSNAQPIMSSQPPQQTVAINGKLPNHVNRQASIATNVTKPHANDLIDLTDEEEKNKGTSAPVVKTTTADQQINITQKPQQQCFQRVIQTIPSNVAITNHQSPSLRVVQPASQPTPTALVNNMNAPRLAYVMQTNVGSKQFLITPSTTSMRPVTTCRPPFSTITYKTGISTVASDTVQVLTTSAAPNVQMNKHPAPLPDVRNYAPNPHWKLPPPAPSLKISKVANGIVLSWNMTLSDKHADIASYQLYAYQEINGVAPNTSLWKKVGDVRALPLPMACTLTQFSEGNNYYFAVRAVDTHSRKGQYSIPGNISL